MFGFFEWVLGALAWLLANAVYLDLRRKRRHPFARWVLFCAGSPGTILTFLTVRAGSARPIEPPPDADALLLAEIRADRERRETLPPPIHGGALSEMSEEAAEG